MNRLRYLAGILAAWSDLALAFLAQLVHELGRLGPVLAVTDFLHGPPRPWRHRPGIEVIGNDTGDEQVLTAGTDPTLTAADRLHLAQQFEQIVLRLDPISPPRNPQRRGRHR